MVAPYRQPKPLSGLISPDRRRQKTALIVIASMIAGVVLFEVGRGLLETSHAPPPPVGGRGPTPGPLTPAEVQGVIAAHRTALKQACWDGRAEASDSAKVTLSLIVAANGEVASASASGSDARVASCVEEQARTWSFAAHGESSSTIQVPFLFSRE